MINKISYYIRNEEEIIQNIKNSLSLLSSYYSSSNNTKIIDNKIIDLNSSLSTMLDNKKKYVEFLVNVVNEYITENDKNIADFQKNI